jgi:hypothetical protein
MESLPYVTAALICEKVIQEKDGTLSAIRIVDRAELGIQTNDPNVRNVVQAIQLTGLVCIKAGPAKGSGLLTIDIVNPSRKTTRLGQFALDLHGEDQGQNFVLNMVIAPQEDGLHWFDVRVDDQLLSKIPLTLLRTAPQVVTVAPTNEPPKTAG